MPIGNAHLLLATDTRRFPTWSPTNKASTITLSNNNLTFTGTPSGLGSGIATIGKSTGKWYWEIFVNYTLPAIGTAGALEAFGIADSHSATQVVGAYANSAAYRRNNGNLNNTWTRNFGSVGFVGSAAVDYATNNVISFALDLDSATKTISTYVDGAAVGSALTLPNGVTWYPACGADGSQGVGTANFGATGFNILTATLRNTLLSSGYKMGFYN